MTQGRPPSYAPKNAEIARKAYELGAVDDDVADMFDISVRTLYRWRIQHKAFADACAVGKEYADEWIAASLYQRARGFEYTAERVFMFAKSEEPIIARYAKRVLGNPRVALQWLRIRQPEKWRIPRDDEGKEELSDIIEQAFARAAERRRNEQDQD